jgi:hypothetical protein
VPPGYRIDTGICRAAPTGRMDQMIGPRGTGLKVMAWMLPDQLM